MSCSANNVSPGTSHTHHNNTRSRGRCTGHQVLQRLLENQDAVEARKPWPRFRREEAAAVGCATACGLPRRARIRVDAGLSARLLGEAFEVYARALEDGVDRHLEGRSVKPAIRPYA